MPKKFEAQVLDLGGGLNDSYDPAALNARFSSVLRNFFPYGPHLHRRNGIIRQNEVEHSERITGLFAYGKQVGSWILVVGDRVGLNTLSFGVVVPIANLDSVSILATDDVWRMRQYKGIGYAVRPGVEALLRFTETGFSIAGIEAPTTTPTIAAGGGGSGVMEAGDRHIVMTFFNPDTDVESNPSPVSAVVTLAADDSIIVNNAEVPTDPQVGGRRFYVELPNIEGQYYLALETLDVISTGPFTINKDIDELGGLASFKNAPPVEQEYVDLEVWKERLWLTNGFDIFFSQNIGGIGLAECFSATDFLQIYPDDRNHVTVLLAVGERLIVGKTNGIHAILASGSSFEVQTISDRQGCIAGGSMKGAEGQFWWYSGDNVYQSNGSSMEPVSDPTILGGSRVRDLLDSIPNAFKSTVQAAIHPRLGWYMLSVPTGDSSLPTHTAVYDYRNRRWFIFDHTELGAPTVFGDFNDAQEQPRVYCAYFGANNVYDYIGTEATLTDDGVPIEAEWRSAGADCGAPGYLHRLRFGGVMVMPIEATATIKVFEDNQAVASLTRQNVRLSQVRQVQRIKLPSIKSYHTQLGILYNQEPKLIVKGAFWHADVWGYKEQPE